MKLCSLADIHHAVLLVLVGLERGKCVETHAGVHMDLCGCVQVHVELRPDGQDKKEEQTLSNTKGFCDSAQLWRSLDAG